MNQINSSFTALIASAFVFREVSVHGAFTFHFVACTPIAKKTDADELLELSEKSGVRIS
jgi:hypothetical protein